MLYSYESYEHAAYINRKIMTIRRRRKNRLRNDLIITTIHEEIPLEDLPPRDLVPQEIVVSEKVVYKGIWWKNAW